MALKIVTGGTTGAADGTLVSSGNPLVITALNTPIDAHIRCDDGYWSNDQDFDVPAELQVSFDGGSTWYGNADEPITAPELYAVNYPIKIRQTTAAASTSGSFITNGTYTAVAALATPTLTATVDSKTQITLSWTDSNANAESSYKLEWSPNGSTGWTQIGGTIASATTSYAHSGLTAGTRYWYRITAVGSAAGAGRYTDSGYGTDDDTTLPPTFSALSSAFAVTTTGYIPGPICLGPDGNMWCVGYKNGSPFGARLFKITHAGTVTDYGDVPSGGGAQVEYICSDGTNLWFTGTAVGRIWKATTSGSMTSYTGFTAPRGIAYGPDSNLWVCDTDNVRKVNPADGTITSSYAATSKGPEAITTDGTSLWATFTTANSIAKITTAGSITEYTSGLTAAAGLAGITYNANDGNLWAAEDGGSRIVKITPAGAITEYAYSTGKRPLRIAVGPDQKLWVGSYTGDVITEFTTAGSYTEHALTGASYHPSNGLAAGTDTIWITSSTLTSIGKVTFA